MRKRETFAHLTFIVSRFAWYSSIKFEDLVKNSPGGRRLALKKTADELVEFAASRSVITML